MFDFVPPSGPDGQETPRDPVGQQTPQRALQQSDLWRTALTLLGTPSEMVHIGTERALMMRRDLPLLGGIGLLSRADLRLSTARARGLRAALGVRHLIVNAETAEDAASLKDAGFSRVVAPRRVAELALDPSCDVMAARLDQKWRNRLRHGLRNGIVVRRRPLPPDRRYWLFRSEQVQARALRYRPLPPECICAMVACRPGAGQVFTAYHNGQKVASMLFLRHGVTATYQIGWTAPEGRSLSAGSVCFWRAMVELQAMGIERLDLGAADPTTAPGLARFKLGTGAQPRDLGGTWLDSAWWPNRALLPFVARAAASDERATI